MIKERKIYKEIMKYLDSPEAIIITGMRRTGKTTLLKYIYGNIRSENKIFIDMENPINRRYFDEEDYENIKTSFELMGVNFRKKCYIFIDEIQFVKNLPSVVKYFIDHYNVKFFLTGSASFYLKNLFTESLTGRKFIFELYPLSFEEFLLFKESKLRIPENTEKLSKAVFSKLSDLYNEYILFGGFPAVVLKPSIEEKRMALNEIFTSFFNLEVLQLGDFRRNEVIRDLILLLSERIGSRIDIQKLSRYLGVSRPTIKEYLNFLEGTYLISFVRPFSSGKDTEIRKSPKVYFCDTGLARQLGNVTEGALFENSVYQSLRGKGKVCYFQKKSGVEIDFILNNKTAFEVKLKPEPKDLKRLNRLAVELGLKEFYLVSKHYTDLKNTIYGFML